MEKKATKEELISEAKSLYVFEGKLPEEIATLLGVSAKTLLGWVGRYGWKRKRQERKTALKELADSLHLLKEKMLEKALDTLSPQDVKVALALEKAIHQREKEQKNGSPEAYLEAFQRLVEILKDKFPAALKAIDENYEAILAEIKKELA